MIYPTFSDFKEMALSKSLTDHEKIGFGNSRNKNSDRDIFNDIDSKLNITKREKLKVLDVGCGCAELVRQTQKACDQQSHHLHLIDSQEMLSLVEHPKEFKYTGQFPLDFKDFIKAHEGTFDIILCYSVLQCVLQDPQGNPIYFTDQLVRLLSENGKLLIGDIANSSKQSRFIASSMGKKMHKLWGTKPTKHNTIEESRIDDSFILNILSRYRSNGYNAYLLPLNENLSFNYTREDILITK